MRLDELCSILRFKRRTTDDTVLLRNNLTLRSRSERVPNAVGTRLERVPEETWKRVPHFG
jgi:hypothetical protein